MFSQQTVWLGWRQHCFLAHCQKYSIQFVVRQVSTKLQFIIDNTKTSMLIRGEQRKKNIVTHLNKTKVQ